MDVREWKDEIVFLHKVKPGAADRSYGIQVAKLAGLPKQVTTRAAEVLALLEKSRRQGARRRRPARRPAAVRRRAPKSHVAANAAPSPVEAALAAINPDELTPKAALEALYRLKELLGRTASKSRPHSARRQQIEHRSPVGPAGLVEERGNRCYEGRMPTLAEVEDLAALGQDRLPRRPILLDGKPALHRDRGGSRPAHRLLQLRRPASNDGRCRKIGREM